MKLQQSVQPLPQMRGALGGDVAFPSAGTIAWSVALNSAFVTPGLYIAGVRGWRLLTGSVLGGLSYAILSALWDRYVVGPAIQSAAAPQPTPTPKVNENNEPLGRVIDVPPRRRPPQ